MSPSCPSYETDTLVHTSQIFGLSLVAARYDPLQLSFATPAIALAVLANAALANVVSATAAIATADLVNTAVLLLSSPLPLPLSPPLQPPPLPQVHELMPPPPSPIAAAPPNLSEDTEAKTNSRRAQEEANVPSIGNGEADSITNSQAQVSHNNNHNPAHTKGKSTCGESNNTDDSNHSSGDRHHTYDTKGVSTSDDHILVYDPGGNDINTRVGSMRDNGDSSSSSSDSAPCTSDAYHIPDRGRDKTPFTASDVDPVLNFMQDDCSVSSIAPPPTDNSPAILQADSKRIDATQHPPSLQHLAHPLDFDHGPPVSFFLPPSPCTTFDCV